MKRICYLTLICVLFVACNPIPQKSVFEELTTDELASAIKAVPEFAKEYEAIRIVVQLADFSEVQKVQYKDVTYRRLYSYLNHAYDSIYWAPSEVKWGKEWDNTFAKDLEKVPEQVDYWNEYKSKHSLSRFANVELSRFDATYYEYIGGVEDAYIYFNITPLQGPIEQIVFTYSYAYKINNGKEKTSQKCIYSSPIYRTTEAAWELDYFEKEKFGDMIASEFYEKYDMDIEITNVRKDGKNYSLEDLNIPEAITAIWEDWNPETCDGVAALINPSYVSRNAYIENKKNEELREYDSLCADFCDALSQKNIFDETE